MQTVDLNEKQKSLGIGKGYAPQTDEYKELVNYANLKLATLGLPTVGDQSKTRSALEYALDQGRLREMACSGVIFVRRTKEFKLSSRTF